MTLAQNHLQQLSGNKLKHNKMLKKSLQRIYL